MGVAFDLCPLIEEKILQKGVIRDSFGILLGRLYHRGCLVPFSGPSSQSHQSRPVDSLTAI